MCLLLCSAFLYCTLDSKVHGAYLCFVGPRWAPCWPHEPCYQGSFMIVLSTSTWRVIHIRQVSSPGASFAKPLQWRHDGRDGVWNHQIYHCLLNRLFGHRSKKTSKLRVTGLCVGNSPVTGEFPAQMASNAENVSIWWRHHANIKFGS